MFEMIKYKWNQLFCLHTFKCLHYSARKVYNEGYTISKIYSYTMRCDKCGKVKKNVSEKQMYILIAEGDVRENEKICDK